MRSTKPLVHFLLVGALLFTAERWRAGEPGEGAPRERPAIVVSEADVARLRAGLAQTDGAALDDARRGGDDARGLVDRLVDEEILHREGLALASSRRDPVVGRRLAALVRALELGETGEGRELEQEARSLGLERSDAVVRRYLVEAMRLALSRPAPGDLPDEEEIREYYARHAARFAAPPTVVLTHVYLSADRRGPAAGAEAERLLARLLAERVGPEGAARLGDAFARGSELRASPAELDRVFGPGFAAAADGLPLGTWGGPVPSAYGVHLVWVRERAAPRVPVLDAVRGRVVHALLRERGEERLRSRLAELRGRYRIETPLDRGPGAAR